MKYSMVFTALTPFLLMSASADSIPPGTVHKPNWGNAIVKNQCSEPAYYVFDNEASTGTIQAGGQMQVPIWMKSSNNGGLSIKLFTDKSTNIWGNDPCTQFEITATDLQYFDISNVNSNIGNGMNGNGEVCTGLPPFVKGGMRIYGDNVPDVECHPGENPCKTAYSRNDDNFATAASPLGKDITLVLCPEGGSNAGDSSSGANSGSSNQVQQQSSVAPVASSTPATPIVQQKAKVKAPVQQSTTPAPSPKPVVAEEIIWVTHVVTADPVIVTERVDAHQKRAEHIHQHAHNKVHKRRITL